jgi:DNA-directed RNA polymerase specialized sigma24 family protein
MKRTFVIAGRHGAILALVVGLIAAVNGGLNVAVATGGPVAGNGVVGGATAFVSGPIAGHRRAGSGPQSPDRPGAGAHDVSSTRGMSDPAASFEPYRRRLRGLAYRMLGSMADAEDAVQETYLRWHGADRDAASEPRAFLMTTTARISLDMLTSACARREEYVGPWLPEPVLDTGALAPDRRSELAEDLSIALLLTLDRLSALERAAFLVHDVFDFSFSEVIEDADRAARFRVEVTRKRPGAWWRDDFTVRFAVINGLRDRG